MKTNRPGPHPVSQPQSEVSTQETTVLSSDNNLLLPKVIKFAVLRETTYLQTKPTILYLPTYLQTTLKRQKTTTQLGKTLRRFFKMAGFDDHKYMLFLDRKLYLATVQLQAERGLAQSFAAPRGSVCAVDNVEGCACGVAWSAFVVGAHQLDLFWLLLPRFFRFN